MKRIYLDYAASTPVGPEVLRAMEPYFGERFGNPGSLHSFGQEAIAAVDAARETIAKAIGCGFREVVFAASATEANNLALRGAIVRFREEHGRKGKLPRIIASAIEHESVIETARSLAEAGMAEAVFVPVDAHGVVDEKKIKENLTPETAVVSVMYANNEVGTIQPVGEIAAMVKDARGAAAFPLFHTDAAQAPQFLDCRADHLGADLITFSSHKLYGPKGAGALYIRGEAKTLRPAMTGGGQEFGLRPGTENVPAIVGFAKAFALAGGVREKESQRIGKLRERLWAGIKEIFPKAEINGPHEAALALPNILNVYFPGRAAQDLLTRFDLAGLAASSASACRSRAIGPSYVIQAMGSTKERAGQSIRFSLGRPTTEKEIEEALAVMAKSI